MFQISFGAQKVKEPIGTNWALISRNLYSEQNVVESSTWS